MYVNAENSVIAHRLYRVVRNLNVAHELQCMDSLLTHNDSHFLSSQMLRMLWAFTSCSAFLMLAGNDQQTILRKKIEMRTGDL